MLEISSHEPVWICWWPRIWQTIIHEEKEQLLLSFVLLGCLFLFLSSQCHAEIPYYGHCADGVVNPRRTQICFWSSTASFEIQCGTSCQSVVEKIMARASQEDKWPRILEEHLCVGQKRKKKRSIGCYSSPYRPPIDRILRYTVIPIKNQDRVNRPTPWKIFTSKLNLCMFVQLVRKQFYREPSWGQQKGRFRIDRKHTWTNSAARISRELKSWFTKQLVWHSTRYTNLSIFGVTRERENTTDFISENRFRGRRRSSCWMIN